MNARGEQRAIDLSWSSYVFYVYVQIQQEAKVLSGQELSSSNNLGHRNKGKVRSIYIIFIICIYYHYYVFIIILFIFITIILLFNSKIFLF